MGGAYSSLAETLQLPLSYVLLYETDRSIMRLMADGLGSVEIVTGVNSLSKSTEVNNLISAMQEGQAIVAMVSQIDQRVDTNRIMDEVYKSYAIDTERYMKTKEQLEAEASAQAEQMQGQQEMEQAMALSNGVSNE